MQSSQCYVHGGNFSYAGAAASGSQEQQQQQQVSMQQQRSQPANGSNMPRSR
jgi:hypothetical protein